MKSLVITNLQDTKMEELDSRFNSFLATSFVLLLLSLFGKGFELSPYESFLLIYTIRDRDKQSIQSILLNK